MADVQVRLSGAIEARCDGEPVALPGRRVRALLVMLALSAGRTVPVDALARGIWDDDPPARVRGSLQTYIGRLRRALGSERIVTDEFGYHLDVSADAVDLLHFERLANTPPDMDPTAEAARLDEALALWVGDPFAGAPSAWIEQHLVPDLVERYLQAVERRIDLDLADGDASLHLSALRNLVERHPLRETLWMRLLTALDRAGRTAEALERYEALRNHLVEELGVDPSPDLQHLHNQLLTKEAPTSVLGAAAPAVVPSQLPPAITGFTGRSEQLAALESMIATHDSSVVALHGQGGVGKTALAVHWAWQNRKRFPGGQLFVDLRGYGPGAPMEPTEALDELLRAIGVPGAQIPDDAEGRSSLLRTELSMRKALVVLDNAREAAQVRPLLAGGSTTTLVTSRSQLRSLVSREGARRIAVKPMPTGDAVALLADRFRVTVPDDELLADLAGLCGRLPVALTVAAERAGRDEQPRIADVNERLRDERDRLAALTDWTDDPLTDVRAVFSWSYQALDSDTARMFRLIGCHPHPRVSIGSAAALAGIDERAAERLLDRLADRHLVAEIALGWYELHDLTRAYATELAASDPDETATAVRRLRSWYLHSASNANEIQASPVLTYSVPAVLPGLAPATFDSPEHATDWLGSHWSTIGALLRDAADDGDDDTVARLTPMLYLYFKFSGASREGSEMFRLAEQSARRTGEHALEAKCSLQLGYFLEDLGDHDASLSQYAAARTLFADVTDPSGRVSAEIAIGTARARDGQFDDAIEMLNNALVDVDGADDRLLPTIHNNLATVYLMIGRVEEGRVAAERGVEAAYNTATSDEDHLAFCHLTLGEAYSAAEDWAESITTLTEARRLFAASGNAVGEILARHTRGIGHRELNDRAAAHTDWTAALDLLDTLGLEDLPGHGDPRVGQRGELHELLACLGDDLSGGAGR